MLRATHSRHGDRSTASTSRDGIIATCRNIPAVASATRVDTLGAPTLKLHGRDTTSRVVVYCCRLIRNRITASNGASGTSVTALADPSYSTSSGAPRRPLPEGPRRLAQTHVGEGDMGELCQLLPDGCGARAGDAEGGAATDGGSFGHALQGMLSGFGSQTCGLVQGPG